MIPLALARGGDEVRVRALRGTNGHTQRLRELGLMEGRTLRVIANNDPLICQIGESRFGVCRRLARCVVVESADTPSSLPVP
jgi:Fe2+ transport system protein FeoA